MSIYIDNFDTIYGVKTNIQALRNKVLELAVRGKLVEHSPDDEPAYELIKLIKSERNVLANEGRVKRQKPVAKIEEDEIPFDLPKSWEWVRLGDIAEFINGDRGKNYPSKTDLVDSGIPFINAGHLVCGKVDTTNMNFISEAKYNQLSSGKILPNDIIYCLRGTLGKCAINTLTIGAIASSLVLIRQFAHIDVEYIYTYLISPTGKSIINIHNNGTAQPNLSAESVMRYLIPIPPLAEQHRIVAKVNSLMAEIDKLEESLQKKQQIMGLLPKAVVDSIGSCKNGEELKEQLQFVISNFETIFQTPESMQDLRNVILQLAIEGKLVPQDPGDEPASELIKRIKTGKEGLVKDGKIKKQKTLKPIEDEARPFGIPENWEWARLEDIATLIMGQSPDGELVTNNIEDGLEFHQGKTNFGNKNLRQSGKYTKVTTKVAPQNSLLISVRAPVGTLNYTDREICIGRGLAALIPAEEVCIDYLYYSVSALQSWLIEKATGTTFKAITGDVLSSLQIPIPPLLEQHRILDKVESIMSLIDQMEAELRRKVDLVEKMASA